MKGLIKDVIALIGIAAILSVILSRFPITKFPEYFHNTISGLFTYFLKPQEKNIYFEILLEKNSQYEMKGLFDLLLEGNMIEVVLDKIAVSEQPNLNSIINFKCIEDCEIKKLTNYLEFSGKVSNLVLNNFTFSSPEKIKISGKIKELKKFDINFKSKKIDICISNATIVVAYGAHKTEQKVYSDCIKLDNIIKISLTYDEKEIKIFGYTSSFKSAFISI